MCVCVCVCVSIRASGSHCQSVSVTFAVRMKLPLVEPRIFILENSYSAARLCFATLFRARVYLMTLVNMCVHACVYCVSGEREREGERESKS